MGTIPLCYQGWVACHGCMDCVMLMVHVHVLGYIFCRTPPPHYGGGVLHGWYEMTGVTAVPPEWLTELAPGVSQRPW
jgi:hypothetical protein